MYGSNHSISDPSYLNMDSVKPSECRKREIRTRIMKLNRRFLNRLKDFFITLNQRELDHYLCLVIGGIAGYLLLNSFR